MKSLVLLILWCLAAFQSFAQAVVYPQSGSGAKTLIIGGQPISITQAPWQVSIKTSKGTSSASDHIGGGSIVERRWILTSASALIDQLPTDLQIRAGATDQASGGQLVQVAQIIRHPNFNPSTLENDLALLQLASPLVLSPSVQVIQYASATTLPDNLMDAGQMASITGWGATVDGSYSVTNQLYKADMPFVTNAYANLRNQVNVPVIGPPIPPVTATMIALFQAGKGTGNFDGGGPVVVLNNGTPVLAGCSSWSRDPRDQYPTICTRVKSFAPWIRSVLPTPLAVNLNINRVPQLDDIVRVDCYAAASGGAGGYTYQWIVEFSSGLAYLTTPSAIPSHSFSVRQDEIDRTHITVRVTDSNNQVAEHRIRADQLSEARPIVTVFPNPANQYIEVTVNQAAQADDAQRPVSTDVQLYDMKGNLKATAPSQHGRAVLNSSSLPEGIYHLRVNQGSGSSTRKVIIKH